MVALLVAMSVMAIMMTVVMPVWRQTNQREKEDELVFRGLQYARAVGLYEKKFANTPPPSIDVLVQQRYLRKKYKDPITNDEFLPVTAGQATAATPPGQTAPAQQPAATAGQTLTTRAGGITGVMSKSTATSIRIYNGRTHYNEWLFVYAPPAAAPGAGGGGGTATPGAPGQRGGQQPGVNPGGAGAGGRGNRGGPGGPNGGPGRGGPNGQGGARGQGGQPPFNPFQLPTDVPPARGR